MGRGRAMERASLTVSLQNFAQNTKHTAICTLQSPVKHRKVLARHQNIWAAKGEAFKGYLQWIADLHARQGVLRPSRMRNQQGVVHSQRRIPPNVSLEKSVESHRL